MRIENENRDFFVTLHPKFLSYGIETCNLQYADAAEGAF